MPEEYTLPVVTDTPSSNIVTLTLIDPQNALNRWVYSFYVTPDQFEVETPSRVAVYQSIGGGSYIDHLGEGITSINMTGNTGFRQGQSNRLGTAALQAALLRDIVRKYNDFCRRGFSSKTILKLQVSFADDPAFGEWNVTVKNFVVQRSMSMPLLFRYTLNLVCLTVNLQDVSRVPPVNSKVHNSPVTVEPEIVVLSPEGEAEVVRSDAIDTPVSEPAAQEVAPAVTTKTKAEASAAQMAALVSAPQYFTYKIPSSPANATTIINGTTYVIGEGSARIATEYTYSYGKGLFISSHTKDIVIPDEQDRMLVAIITPVPLYTSNNWRIVRVSDVSLKYAAAGFQRLVARGSHVNTEIWYCKSPASGTDYLTVSLSEPSALSMSIFSFYRVNLNNPLYTGTDISLTVSSVGNFITNDASSNTVSPTVYSTNSSTLPYLTNLPVVKGDLLIGSHAGYYSVTQARGMNDTKSLGSSSSDGVRQNLSLSAFYDKLSQQVFYKTITETGNANIGAVYDDAGVRAQPWSFLEFGVSAQRTAPEGGGSRLAAASDYYKAPPMSIADILNEFWNVESDRNQSKTLKEGITYDFSTALGEFLAGNPEFSGYNLHASLPAGEKVRIPEKYKH
jgi:hypothetical protein